MSNIPNFFQPTKKSAIDGQIGLIPSNQLKAVRTHLQLLQARIIDLTNTVVAQGRMEGAQWPEILNKYNNILQQTALITEQLTSTITGGSYAAALAASQSTDWPRPPINSLPNLLVHPNQPIPQEKANLYLSLLQTRRDPTVETSDIEIVSKFEKAREETAKKSHPPGTVPSINPGRIGPTPMGGFSSLNRGVNGTEQPSDKPTFTPQQILEEMESLRAEQDARADRALRAVQMLRDKYDWKERLDPAAEEAEDEQQAALSRNNDMDASDDEADENETEEQMMLDKNGSDAGESEEDLPLAAKSRPNVEIPPPSEAAEEVQSSALDSDDDLFEEVA